MNHLSHLLSKRQEINHQIAVAEGCAEAATQALSLGQRAIGEVSRVIVGQRRLLERLMVALISNGHVLVEGAPGLAKTLALKTLARVVDLSFARVQFTPDLLPSDLTGTRVFNPKNSEFSTELGPICHNLVLADEINRAPAKTQAALLEAMGERQITIGRETFALERPFLVMATQNPIESEGTYDLPEAQLDRFMMKVLVDYPNSNDERQIIQRISCESEADLQVVVSKPQLCELQRLASAVHLPDTVQDRIVSVVLATRQPSRWLQYGASPRASLALANGAKALALLSGRTEATVHDVDSLIGDCLRHRLILSHDALVAGRSADDVLAEIVPASNVENPLPQLGRHER